MSIALPVALALAADPLTSLVDTAFVGRLGTKFDFFYGYSYCDSNPDLLGHYKLQKLYYSTGYYLFPMNTGLFGNYCVTIYFAIVSNISIQASIQSHNHSLLVSEREEEKRSGSTMVVLLRDR